MVSKRQLSCKIRTKTYTLLECRDLLIGKGVCLSNDWDEVDLGMESTHDLYVQRLQRVASRLNEVNASVDTVIHNIHAVDLVFGIKVRIETLLNVLDDWPP